MDRPKTLDIYENEDGDLEGVDEDGNTFTKGTWISTSGVGDTYGPDHPKVPEPVQRMRAYEEERHGRKR